eukprot:gene549-238_t
MPTDELGMVLFEFSDTAAVFPRDVRLHDLFRQQVQRHPNAV